MRLMLVLLLSTFCAAFLDPLPLYFYNKLDCIAQDGNITLDELRHVATLHDAHHFQPPSIERMLPIHTKLDDNADGVINWDEFRSYYSRLDVPYDSTTPSQIHISLTNDPTQVVVMWALNDTSSSVVVVGSSSGASDVGNFYGTWDTYSVTKDTYVYTSLPIHTTRVKGLKAGTTYYYRCGSANVLSQEFSFTTAPVSPSIVPKVSWAVYGDMGTVMPFGFEVMNWLVAEHTRNPFDLLLHVGDLSYAGFSNLEWEAVWDDWMNQIQPLASIIPYQVTVGNHESYYNYTSFKTRFNTPANFSQGKFWYSFDYGNVHMVCMSMDNSYDVGSEQYSWLENDLANAYQLQINSPYPIFVILAGHRPFLSSDEFEYDQHCPGAHLLSVIEPLIVKYKVDLTLTGHVHAYERTLPTINGTTKYTPSAKSFTNPTEPIHIVQGTGGAELGHQWVRPQPVWSSYREHEFGYGRMEISTTATSSTLHYRFQSLIDGYVLDEFTLTKTK